METVKTNFFNLIGQQLPDRDMSLKLMHKNGKITIGIFPEKGNTISVAGTPDELDEGFFDALKKLVEVKPGLTTTVGEEPKKNAVVKSAGVKKVAAKKAAPPKKKTEPVKAVVAKKKPAAIKRTVVEKVKVEAEVKPEPSTLTALKKITLKERMAADAPAADVEQTESQTLGLRIPFPEEKEKATASGATIRFGANGLLAIGGAGVGLLGLKAGDKIDIHFGSSILIGKTTEGITLRAESAALLARGSKALLANAKELMKQVYEQFGITEMKGMTFKLSPDRLNPSAGAWYEIMKPEVK